ncbi:MAG: right-handed parallel beta-helix repeat-containing protein [Rhodocyclaceae bacterium]
MRAAHKLAVLPALLLAIASPGVTSEEPARRGGERPAAPSHDAVVMSAPRVDVDKPAESIPLRLRDKRIHGLAPFQALIDSAPAGSVLRVAPGTYAGPVRVGKPLVIDGGGRVTIDGGDKGTVFAIEGNGITVRNLAITGSGDSHDSDDACLNVRGHHNVIENLDIQDCLFGIDLKQSNDTTVRGNRIRSKRLDLGVRGDGLRLWYSNDNRIENNEIVDARDTVAWYSHRNVFRGNVGRRSRYSIHFMFANDNLVEGNRFEDNAVGMYFMYAEGGAARNNVITHATGATGMALGFKEASNIDVEGNEIIYCAVGVGSDLSPYQPDTTIRFTGNRFAYDGVAVRITGAFGNNVFEDNVFEGNLADLELSGRTEAGRNTWRGNYFDTYEGFDRNHDGVGDTPHADYTYADQIWMEIPEARFFKASPVLELLDFLERLAPFSSPNLRLRDEAPRFHRPARARPGSMS